VSRVMGFIINAAMTLRMMQFNNNQG